MLQNFKNMALNIPKNKIKEKYTSGGEFIIEATNAPYKGYYYELNSILYAGKTFDLNAPKLTPISNRNALLSKGKSTALYSAITGITSQQIQSPNITSIPNGPSSIKGIDSNVSKFYCRKRNQQPIIIKEINKDTYDQLKTNPLYQVTTVLFIPSPGYAQGIPQNINEAESQLPGIKDFLGF